MVRRPVLTIGLCLCWAMVALNGPAMAQQPPTDTDIEAFTKAIEPLVRSVADSQHGAATTSTVNTVAVLTSLAGILGFAWRVAPRIGKDADVSAALARLEEQLKALKESNDKGFVDVKGEINDLCTRVSTLEQPRPPGMHSRR